MNDLDKEKLIEKDIKSVENRIRHAFNQGYEAGLKHGKEQEPCDDAISRQAVLKWIHQSLSEYGNTYTTDMLDMWGLFKEQIKTFPTVNTKAESEDKE